MGKINMLVAGTICALSLVGVGCTVPSFGGGKQSSAEQAASGFLSAIERKDKEAAKTFIEPESEMSTNFDAMWTDIEKVPLNSFSVKSTENDAVSVELNLVVEDKPETVTGTVKTVNKDGKWYVNDLQ